MRLRPVPFVIALVGVAMVAFATPRLVAGVIVSPFDETVRALGRGEPVSDEALRLALGSRQRAIQIVGDGQLWADAAALQFAAWRRAPDDPGRLDAAIAAHRAALLRAPSQPFVWNRLALAQTLRDGYGDGVAGALRASLATGRFEPRLTLPRLELAMPVWGLLPDDLQAEFGEQIVLAMRWDPEALVAATHRHWRLAEVRRALAAYPELRSRFNLIYERRRAPN